MTTYTYTIFDADPQSSSGTAWPTHQDLEIEADSDQEALEEVRGVMRLERHHCRPQDGYAVGDRIHAIVWDATGIIVGQPAYELTAEDMGLPDMDEGQYRIEYIDGGDCCAECCDRVEALVRDGSIVSAEQRDLIDEAVGECEYRCRASQSHRWYDYRGNEV